MFRWAIALQALVFHRQVLFYPQHLFPWDFRGVHLPLATLLADSFRRGQWPLWDPFTYCGVPIFGNIQAASFYPPVLGATLVGAWLGDDFLPKLLAFSVAAQIIFAGLCAFELMRRLDAGPAAAYIGATVFELGCFFAAQAEHMGAMQGAAWLPLAWLSVVELSGAFRKKWLAALTVALAMTVLAGLPQVAVAAFASATALAILLALFRQTGWNTVAITLAACVWALLLAAIQFWPTAEFTQNSIAKYRADWMGSGGGTPPVALYSLVIPNYWNVFDLSKFHGPTDPTFLYLYSSLLGLALALGAIFWRPAKKEAAFAALLAFFTLAMFGDQTRIGRAVLLSLPDRIRIGIHPEFLFCVFSLALAVLAGLGAEKLLRSSRAQVLAGIVIVLDLILVGSGRPMNEEPAGNQGFTHDSGGGSRQLVTRLREILNRSIPPARYDTAPDIWVLWSDIGPILQLPTSNGCDPMAPERTIQVRLAFAKGARWGGCYQVENPASPALGLMNARVLLSHREVTAPGFKLAAEIDGYKLYENLSVVDRFFFPQRVRSVASLQEAAQAIHSPDFRPAEEAVVEDAGAEALNETFSAPSGFAQVRVISFTPSAIRVETGAAAPEFLIDTDLFYPGWQASVDGIPTRLYAADAAFRGVKVPAGKHIVDFRLSPRTLYWAAALSGAALAGIVIMCLL